MEGRIGGGPNNQTIDVSRREIYRGGWHEKMFVFMLMRNL